jgi:FkbM family methyltransferase
MTHVADEPPRRWMRVGLLRKEARAPVPESTGSKRAVTFVQRALRSLIRAAYTTKRRHGLGDRFLANHPRVTRSLMSLLVPFKSASMVDVHGHIIKVDPGDYLGLTINSVYEPDVTFFLERSVKKGDRALDLGANIGYFTLLLAKLVGVEGHVIAFEPDAQNFALLEQNVRANDLENVDLRRQAVSDRSGTTFLYRNPFNPGDHRLVGDAGMPREEAEMVALDDVVRQEFGRLRWIKMDIQGGELAALRGMRSLIASCPDLTIVSEVFPRALADFGEDPAELSSLIDEGFAIRELRSDGTLRDTTLARVFDCANVSNGKYVNVVFSKTG